MLAPARGLRVHPVDAARKGLDGWKHWDAFTASMRWSRAGRAASARASCEPSSAKAHACWWWRARRDEARPSRGSSGLRSCIRSLDVTDDEGWRRLIDAHAADPFDVLVSNAGGLLHAKTLLDIGVDEWRQELDVNLTAHFLGIRHVLPAMLERRRGSIILIGSMSGMRGQRDATAYQVSKAGLRMLAKNATVTYSSRGVRFNMINPGFIDTTGSEGRLTDRERWFFDRIPMGRLGSTADIAAAAVFLASDESSYVTGLDLQVDGGYEV